MRLELGRWQDTLPGTYDPARAVVITDPPYGLQANGSRGPGSHMAKAHDPAVEKGYPDTIPWAHHVAEVLELLPAKRHCIRGPAPALIGRDYPQPRRVAVEVQGYRRRPQSRPGVVPYLWQGWAIYGRLLIDRRPTFPPGDALATRYPGGDPRNHRPRTDHRALTPFSACLWIIETWADPGMVVIDPFAGLGTIGLAARTLGFDYIGAELEPEYHRVALEAFSTERLTLGMVG